MHAFLVTRVAALRRALVPRWLTWPGRYGLVVILGLVVVTGVPWSGPTAAVQASVGTPRTLRTAATAVAATSQDPVLVVGGDIACDVGSTVTATTCQQGATSDVVTGLGADAVLPLGDEQYQTASATAFQQMYDPSWGRVKATSHPVAGNHEYLTGGAAGYYGYFGGAAGDTGKGYYSWNIGAWHLIALNSECSQSPQIGCAAGSPQETWLKADLAANPGRCTLAYWHQPLFASGGAGSNSLYQDFWQDLYNAHADVVLNGHAHDYERFAPQTPTGAPDQAGLRQFIVGTGGKDLTGFTAPLPNEEARQDSSFGAMKLVLHQSSYDWQFLPTAGNTWTDTGSGTCHTTTTAPAAPVASFTATPVSGTVPVSTTFTDTSTGTPTTWSWDFGDGTPPDTTQTPQHTYTNPGTYTVTLTATNTTGSNTLTKTNLITTTASNPMTLGGAYTALSPVRVADTRPGSGQANAGMTVAGQSSLVVHLSPTVPAGSSAAALSVTAVNAAQAGFLSVYPTGNAPSAPTSALNFVGGTPCTTAGCVVPNLVMTPVSPTGDVTIYNGSGGPVDVVVDVQGFFSTTNATTSGAGHYYTVPTTRLADTRCSTSAASCGNAQLPPANANLTTLGANQTRDVAVTGQGGLPPTGISAAVVQLTVTNTTGPGYLTAYPTGSTPPTASNVNWASGQTTSNRAVVTVGSNGKISLFANSTTDVIVDVVGYFSDTTTAASAGALFTPVTPGRLIDTRNGPGPLGAGASQSVQVTGHAGIPAEINGNPTAAVINLTDASATANSFLTVTPTTLTPPATTSDLNFAPNEIRANTNIATLSATGALSVYNLTGNTNFIIDTTGYFTKAS